MSLHCVMVLCSRLSLCEPLELSSCRKLLKATSPLGYAADAQSAAICPSFSGLEGTSNFRAAPALELDSETRPSKLRTTHATEPGTIPPLRASDNNLRTCTDGTCYVLSATQPLSRHDATPRPAGRTGRASRARQDIITMTHPQG